MTPKRALIILAILLVSFYTTYHLFDSPEPWMDEGLIIQSAMGLLETGRSALPVAPGVYEPAWYITTGFPLTLPLALAFGVFGVSLETARVTMALFIFCFFIALFFYARRAIGGNAAWLGFFLIVFFGPVYGHGRNVLGEVPGLLCILLALLPLVRGGVLTPKRAFVAGLGAGLAAAAKPIFILFLPALLIALLLRRKELELHKVFLYGLCGVLAPMLFWLVTQFGTIDLALVLAVYANPHELAIGDAITGNLVRYVTEAGPFYFIAALFAWVVSYGVRRMRRETVSLTEEALLIFSLLISLAFLRSAGYYRYFFPAQVFALLYLPRALWYLASLKGRFAQHAAVALVTALLIFQMYETSFRSWTATHYSALRTEALTTFAHGLDSGEELFVYQAPEVMPFVVGHLAYQFVYITPSLVAGSAYASQVHEGRAKRVITPAEFYAKHQDDIFAHYTMSVAFDNYVILTP